MSGDARVLARAMESAGLGRAVPLSQSAPRVFRVAGRREMDLAEIGSASIEEDLKRRDFTVNAMAFDLMTRQWLDPFGGREDLAAGRLRAVSPQNLEEDPLRVLRAARFLATHELAPDPGTSRACRRVAPRLAEVADERIRAEWVKMFEAHRVAPALRWASRARLLGPALRVRQSQAGSLARSAALFDAPSIRRREPASRRRLRLALLCARFRLAPGAAATWLTARRYGRSEAGDVAALLDARVRRARGPHAPEAVGLGPRCRVASPPRRSRSYASCHPASRPRARALSRRVAAARRRGPAVSGADVLEWLRISPGPAGRKAARRSASRDSERDGAHAPESARLASLPTLNSSAAIIGFLDTHRPAQVHREEGGFRPPPEAHAAAAAADQGTADPGEDRGPPARGARGDAPRDPDARPEAAARAEPVGRHRLRPAGGRPLPRQHLLQRGSLAAVFRRIPFHVRRDRRARPARGPRDLRRASRRGSCSSPGRPARASRRRSPRSSKRSSTPGRSTSSRSRTRSSTSSPTARPRSRSARSAPTRRASPRP